MADQGHIVLYGTSTRTVLVLFFCLLALIFLLIFLYKKLNKEANGEYTIRRIVYKEGGVRDRMRGAAVSLESRLGVRLWPRSDADEDGEEMQDIRDAEGQVEQGGSRGSDREEDEESVESCEKAKAKGDNTDSDENTSLKGSETGEQARLMDQAEAKEEAEEKARDGEVKGEASGGAGLLIDLKQFSGSAIWSEEDGGDGKNGDMTAL